MKRYIKVSGRWIDTLEKQRENSEIYFIKNNYVYMYYLYNDDPEVLIGKLEDEKNGV